MQQPGSYDEVNSFRSVSARRLDWVKAKVVEEGITLQLIHGTDFAAAYLKSAKVDIDVAIRVLAHPHERRHYAIQ